MPSMPVEISQGNAITPARSLLYTLYYIGTVTFLVTLIILPHTATLLPDIAKDVLYIASVPIIMVSAAAMHYINPSEPSHLLLHFSLYLLALSSIGYTFVPFGQWLEIKDSPTTSTCIKVIAWPTGVIMGIYVFDLVFYAIFIFQCLDMGWYGLFHDGLYKAPGILINKNRLWQLGDFFSVMAEVMTTIRVHYDGPTTDSASCEPLLEGVGLNDDPSLPPPYVHNTDTRYIKTAIELV